ncbi:MAG: peptidoglycan DD-metalloendopeptidase family protein [Longicatena sp.]
MKKIKKICLALCMFVFVVMPKENLHAQDFAGNESAWYARCSVAQSTSDAKKECDAFAQWLYEQKDSLNNNVESIKKQVSGIKGDIEAMSQSVRDLQELSDSINKKIELNDASIRTISSEIEKLDESIKIIQSEIDKRNKLIMDRMLSEQSSLGTNINIDIIMGANSLVDFIRKGDGIKRITESDQKEINTIRVEKQKLDLDKSEQSRLKKDAEVKKEENVKNKEHTEELKKEKETILGEYRQKEATLAEKMRSVEVDISTIQNNIIAITSASDLDLSGNTGLALPIRGGYISAGTWAYPGGGTHLGMDIAVSIGTPIVAPAAGIILYAGNPVSTNGGYIGNWSGYPAGGGNTMQLLTQANGITYAISFFHMSQSGFAVSAGTKVAAGQQLGLSGNSGNSSGPHCHIEVINLGSMSLDAAISRFKGGADFAWGNGWGDGARSNVCGIKGPPCRERPENIF